MSASAMTDPVVVDATALRDLAARMRSVADDIAGESIPIPALPGSATSAVKAPGVVAAETRRIGAAVVHWAQAAIRCADELRAADQPGGYLRAQ